MKSIWTNEEAEYHGEFVDFDPIWSWPKPVQSPHPPILIGGETIHTLRRVVNLADGWIPRARNPQQVFDGMETLTRLAEEAGRGSRQYRGVDICTTAGSRGDRAAVGNQSAPIDPLAAGRSRGKHPPAPGAL